MIYLDTSALVKLIRLEPESETLADWLDERVETPWITSALAEVELPRAINRAGIAGGLSAVPALLARLERFEIDTVVRSTAAAYADAALRSLDAIHLATAQVADAVAPLTFVAYDERLANAARTLGLTTAAPGRR